MEDTFDPRVLHLPADIVSDIGHVLGLALYSPPCVVGQGKHSPDRQ